jgi:hypothetical protein
MEMPADDAVGIVGVENARPVDPLARRELEVRDHDGHARLVRDVFPSWVGVMAGKDPQYARSPFRGRADSLLGSLEQFVIWTLCLRAGRTDLDPPSRPPVCLLC